MSTALFPTLAGLTFPVEKTPIWSTKIQPSVSGKETRLAFWSYPIWQYSIDYDLLRSDNVNAELQSLLGFFNARFGSFDSWWFNDPDDNTAVAQRFGTGDGTTTAFQLSRSFGGFTEPVRAINTMGTVTVAGTPTSAFTVNASTGVLTYTSAPASSAALLWSGTFYWQCRFMDDQMTTTKFMRDFWETKSLRFQSIK